MPWAQASGAVVLAAQAVAQQPARSRQLLVGGRGHLGQVHVGVLPGDDVAGPRDADGQLVVLAPDLAHGEDVEQLGVQRPAVELKDQLADTRSQDMHVHGTPAGSRLSGILHFAGL